MARRVIDMVSEQVHRRPHDMALVAPDGRLTYAQLYRQAGAVAAWLTQQGLRPGQTVLVQAPRSLALGTAVLGTMLAGGAFCVIDPRYPSERVHHMWRNSGARYALLAAGQEPVPAAGVRILPLRGAPSTGPDACAVRAEPVAVRDDDAAYAVFTSGSTGAAKALTMPHRCLNNLIGWTLDSSSAAPLRTLLFAPLGFDVLVQELFTAWCSGGCLYTPSDKERGDLERVWQLCKAWRIERLFVPPVALRRFAELTHEFNIVPMSLREVSAAGEQLLITPPVRRLFTRLGAARLHNHYGPAETHVITAHTLTGPPSAWPDKPPIGRPIPGVQVSVRPAPSSGRVPRATGQRGELHVSGVALAHGYVGDLQATKERFEVSVADGRSVRTYRTGDLVRRDKDGLLYHLGRTDDQLKIRGYRVEPAEVEAVLTRHPSVRECAVSAWEPPGSQDRHLVAHVVPAAASAVDADLLRAHAARFLPAHMQPHYVLAADYLPLSPNGKVDRRRLPPPIGSREGHECPRPGSEGWQESVTRLCAEALGRSTVDAGRSFTDLGGTSLTAALVVTRLHARLGVRVSIEEFLNQPSLTAFSTRVAERAAA